MAEGDVLLAGDKKSILAWWNPYLRNAMLVGEGPVGMKRDFRTLDRCLCLGVDGDDRDAVLRFEYRSDTKTRDPVGMRNVEGVHRSAGFPCMEPLRGRRRQ